MADNKKQEYESLWESLVDMGIKKALLLIWSVYTVAYIVAMYILHWVYKHYR
jgi:hypothetical protein